MSAPRMLALDTSTLALSMALVEGTGDAMQTLELCCEGPPKKQSELLPGLVGELLRRHQTRLEELAGIAVGMGPGSFTGLRVGMACVKALAYARKLKVAKVSSLAALALEGPQDALLFPCALARKGDLYFGQYRRRRDVLEEVAPEAAESTEEFARRLLANPDALALGPGLETERSALVAAGVPERRLLVFPTHPSAESVARLARLPETFDAQALFALEPHYLRASEPERNPKFPPLPGPAPTARLKEE